MMVVRLAAANSAIDGNVADDTPAASRSDRLRAFGPAACDRVAMCGPGISRNARLISGMVSKPIGLAMSAPASMKSWQRSMAASGPSTPWASVRAAIHMSGSRRASSAALTLASICSAGIICLPGR